MGWFGKSEAELKAWQNALDIREKSLNEKQAQLNRQQSDLDNRNMIAIKKSEELAEKDRDICFREEKIIRRELNARNNFIKEQREAFKQAIEIQLKELDDREHELNAKQNEIELQLSDLKICEGELAKKERSLKEKELKAENGFADMNKIALREVEKRENNCKELEAQLQERENAIILRHKEQEHKSEELRKREVAIAQAEQKRDEGFSAERKKLDDEFAAKRIAFEKDFSEKRANEFNFLEKILSEESRKRRNALDKKISDTLSQYEKALKAKETDLKNKEKELKNRELNVEDLEFQKAKAKRKQERLDEERNTVKDEIKKGIEGRKKSFQHEVDRLNEEIDRLRDSIKTSSALISNFEELKHKLGDEDPVAVLLKLKTYEEEIKKLRDDLATRPTQEMQEAFDRLKKDQSSLEQACSALSDENFQLKKNAHEQSQLELIISELQAENKSYKQRFEAVDADNNRLIEELKRLQSAYEREQDREARIRDIETPYIPKELPRASLPKSNIKNRENAEYELTWLEGINKSCVDYGLKFPRRILHAFHTALKTSEWSPITVLAGVSGTGKSELPRLYSHFGGINFLSLSVQPNWDSQESMLGFFNSIDNKFDAQPVLRLLAQSQKAQSNDYPFGLEDVMSLILMDEMNLAHVELYFAEFLSKLELRRGRKGNEVPSIEVKLGAGIQHYDLPLGRNVLWAGTMNQDETTKSLSDKVLDRGIVINFPRPTTLERRRQLKPLGDQAPLLSRKLWESWWCRESKFNDDQILPFKGFIEEMNTSLSRVGRALGHRVWQSIEYYMSNYPDVLEAQRTGDDAGLKKAMKVAFEDQLVQKVMPKLRGIETRGKSKSDCLDKIRTQLVNDDYTIIEDFDLACEFGYGQFIWNSANYIKDNENDLKAKKTKNNRSNVMKIPNELKKYAEENNKELWRLTKTEIKKIMKCDPEKAEELKILCKKNKGS